MTDASRLWPECGSATGHGVVLMNDERGPWSYCCKCKQILDYPKPRLVRAASPSVTEQEKT